VDGGHYLSKLLLAIHPPAQFVSSVLANDSDLIFANVVVRHLFSPSSAAMVSGFLEGFRNLTHQDR
jgi:hypothetical protein